MLRMTLERRLLIVNAVLFVAISAAAGTLLTSEREVPGPLELDGIQQALSQQQAAAGPAANSTADTYEKVGQAPVFQTLVIRPTPTATAPPTPIPDPQLSSAIETWKVVGIADGVVFMTDKKRTNDEWMFDMDDPEKRSKDVIWQGQTLKVELKSIDEINLTAEFRYKGKDGLQTVSKGMFDE